MNHKIDGRVLATLPAVKTKQENQPVRMVLLMNLSIQIHQRFWRYISLKTVWDRPTLKRSSCEFLDFICGVVFQTVLCCSQLHYLQHISHWVMKLEAGWQSAKIIICRERNHQILTMIIANILWTLDSDPRTSSEMWVSPIALRSIQSYGNLLSLK